MTRFTKLDTSGHPLPDDATSWVAVCDNATNLIWSVEETDRMTQPRAVEHAKAMALCGLTDWRLPTVEELFLLADRTRYEPAIDTAHFPSCKSSWYWTSTPDASSPSDCAWVVNFDFGFAYWLVHGGSGFVRAVRGPAGQ